MKRIVGTVVALAAVLLTLTGCDNQAARAAKVGGHTISESSLNKYVVKGAKKYTQQDSQSGQSVTIVPRHQALQTLIVLALFDAAFKSKRIVPAAKGQIPTASQVNRVADTLITAAQRAQLKKTYATEGYTNDYFDATIEFQGKLKLLEVALNDDGSDNAVVAALRALKTSVSVNPRYGTWNPQQVSLDEGGAVPSFITLSTAAAPAAPPAG